MNRALSAALLAAFLALSSCAGKGPRAGGATGPTDQADRTIQPDQPAGGPDEAARATLKGAELARKGPCEGFHGRALAKDFPGYDADGDKRVTRDEFVCQAVRRFSALNADHDSHLAGKELEGKPSWAVDANKDQKVSVVEFAAGADGAFLRADANKNGSLTAAEFRNGKL